MVSMVVALYSLHSSIVWLTRRPAFKSIIDHMNYTDSNVTECVCSMAICPAGGVLTGALLQPLTGAENPRPTSVRGRPTMFVTLRSMGASSARLSLPYISMRSGMLWIPKSSRV